MDDSKSRRAALLTKGGVDVPTITPEEQKKILKEALQEWLDAKYAEFGKWTMRGVMAAGLVALVVFLTSHGFKAEDLLR